MSGDRVSRFIVPPAITSSWAKPGVRWARWLLLLGLAASWIAWGVERFPPPEFEPGTYTMPQVEVPSARGHWLEYVDVVLLFGALSLGSYLVLVKRLRKWILWLSVASLAYFGFVRKGCVCPIGSIQDVVLAVSQQGYAVPVSVLLFFLLPLLFTLFLGRAFCAAVCPLGAIQDVVVWKPVKVRPWLEHALGVIPYFYLGLAVLFAATGSAFIICEYDPFVSLFRRSGSVGMLLLGAAFLTVGLFVGRPYCRFLCPYGALLSLLSRFSKWNVTLTPDDCIHCQICDLACPYGAISDPSETPLPAAPPRENRWRLGWLTLLLVGLVAGGGWLGGRLAVPLSQRHPKVRLAERIAAEEAGKAANPMRDAQAAQTGALLPPDNPAETALLASKAFRQTGRPNQELFAEALALRGQFATGGWWLGAFLGLVVGAKLLSLALPESRSIFEPNRALCLACGRCYSHCPKELVRVKKLERLNTALTAPVVKRP